MQWPHEPPSNSLGSWLLQLLPGPVLKDSLLGLSLQVTSRPSPPAWRAGDRKHPHRRTEQPAGPEAGLPSRGHRLQWPGRWGLPTWHRSIADGPHGHCAQALTRQPVRGVGTLGSPSEVWPAALPAAWPFGGRGRKSASFAHWTGQEAAPEPPVAAVPATGLTAKSLGHKGGQRE